MNMMKHLIYSFQVVMLMINGNMLKSLFLFKAGENKGFLELMKANRTNGMIKDAMDRYIERNALIVSDKDLETIKELHDVCVANPSIDSAIAKHVDFLYVNLYQKSRKFKCGGAGE